LQDPKNEGGSTM